MKIVEGGVTKAKGFEAASTAAKIKYEGRTDMALSTVKYRVWRRGRLRQTWSKQLRSGGTDSL